MPAWSRHFVPRTRPRLWASTASTGLTRYARSELPLLIVWAITLLPAPCTAGTLHRSPFPCRGSLPTYHTPKILGWRLCGVVPHGSGAVVVGRGVGSVCRGPGTGNVGSRRVGDPRRAVHGAAAATHPTDSRLAQPAHVAGTRLSFAKKGGVWGGGRDWFGDLTRVCVCVCSDRCRFFDQIVTHTHTHPWPHFSQPILQLDAKGRTGANWFGWQRQQCIVDAGGGAGGGGGSLGKSDRVHAASAAGGLGLWV